MIFPHKVIAYNAANEAWTANQWGADAMINSGVSPEKIFVYEHGLDPKEFFPALRGKNNKIRFLHVDSGSPRKRSDLVEKAFRVLCENNKNIELTLKYSHFLPTALDWSKRETLEKSGEWITPEIRYIKETLSPSHMSELMMFHDVLVYPSEGEGFGLIPLEAMATGMPVISTHEWSSYSKFFIDEAISSKIEQSSVGWGYEKIGNAVIAEFDSIVYQMQRAIDNIEGVSQKYFNQVDSIKKEYTWKNQTKKALDGLIDRIGIEQLQPYLGSPK
jgi:glycosyltransferase involved in cell wall biosynthesis